MPIHAVLTPRYIHMLAPLLATANTRSGYDLMAFHIEPHPTAGAYITAHNAHSMGTFYDATATCTAPISIRLPPDVIDKCATMPLPELFDEGSVYTPAAPPWMVPDKLIITIRQPGEPPVIVIVTHCSDDADHRGVLACATEEDGVTLSPPGTKPPPWHSVFPAPERAVSAHPIQLNPRKLSDFSRITDAPNPWADGYGLMIHPFHAPPHGSRQAPMAVLRVPAHPNFVGALMGMHGDPKLSDLPALPHWLPAQPTTPMDEVAA